MKQIVLFLISICSMISFAMESSSVKLYDDIGQLVYEEEYVDKKKNKKKLILVIGNDGISANQTDRHFTSQIKIGQITKRIPNALRPYIESKNYLIMTLSHEIYTPEDIKTNELVQDDRPYAGWLYFTFGTIKQTEDLLSMTTVDLGIVGPSAQAEIAQIKIHNLIGSDDPNGWEHQLRDEVGINVNVERYHRHLYNLNQYIAIELLNFYGINVGNVRVNARLGTLVRFGKNIPNDKNVGVNLSDEAVSSIFGFFKVEGVLVAHDIFLDGNNFKDSHSVEKENLVGRLSVGITYKKRGWGFTLVQYIQSKEFEDQDLPDTNAQLKFEIDYFF